MGTNHSDHFGISFNLALWTYIRYNSNTYSEREVWRFTAAGICQCQVILREFDWKLLCSTIADVEVICARFEKILPIGCCFVESMFFSEICYSQYHVHHSSKNLRIHYRKEILPVNASDEQEPR